MSNDIYEPDIDPLDDTHPTQTVRQVRLNAPLPLWRRLMGLGTLLAAAGFTFATVLLLMSSGEETVTPPTSLPSQVIQGTDVSVLPTTTAQPTVPIQGEVAQSNAPLPTLDPASASALLSTPVVPQTVIQLARIDRDTLNPFTVIPNRPRTEIVIYTVVAGDTINGIAERFNLKPETIAWSNDRRLVLVLRPGDEVNIPPVDGVLVTAIGGQQTIAEIAAQYQVTDPYIVLDSEYNSLPGLTPDSVPPSGTPIFIPGGVGEQITWNPTVVREEGGGGGSSGGNFISFAPGEAGSCGRVANPGGGGAWVRPLGGYTITRGFSGLHTGIDLSAAEGTPVSAANGGRVIFAGWNSFGYGYTVVLAHGPFTTLYGHLSAIYVGCGQDVAPGQTIAAVGTTGNSSGPHLHFEIRYFDQPQDPAYTIAF